MATTNSDTSTNEDVRELTSKIQQFLSQQIESNGDLSEAAKESLTVATECIEQAYNIQRKPASRDLLNIYRSSKSAPQQQQQHQSQSQQQANSQQAQPDPTQLLSNLASSLFSQVGGNFVNAAASAAANLAAGQPPTGTQATPPAPVPDTATSAGAATTAGASAAQGPRTQRKRATESEVLAAESFKNQGNDCMKADQYQGAYDYYTQAIEIDNNNAIYYSNRAAASSKLGNHQAALRDCQEAIEIDPSYSKAYSRMGLSYASMENHQKAREAYVKAVELDPLNETYKNNLAAAEEKLAEQQGGGAAAGAAGAQAAAGGGANMVNMLRSMMSNPEVMNMAMNTLQDPRLQSVFANLRGPGGPPPSGAPGGH